MSEHENQLDAIVMRCVAFMFEQLVTEFGPFEYDVLAKMLDANGDWHVRLHTPIMAQYIFEFDYKKSDNKLTVWYMQPGPSLILNTDLSS